MTSSTSNWSTAARRWTDSAISSFYDVAFDDSTVHLTASTMRRHWRSPLSADANPSLLRATKFVHQPAYDSDTMTAAAASAVRLLVEPAASGDSSGPDRDVLPAANDRLMTAAAGVFVDRMSLQPPTLTFSANRKNHLMSTVQGQVYNFLERPTGWKCFIYHFTV